MTQITEFWKDIAWLTANNLLWIILLFLPAILIFFIGKRIFSFEKLPLQSLYTTIAYCFLFNIASIYIIDHTDQSNNTAYDLYYKSTAPVLSVQKLGLLTTMRLDLQRQFTDWSPSITEAAPMYPDVDSSKTQKPQENDTNGETKVEAQILPINFDSLIAQEKNDKVKELHQYFSTVPPTNKNAFTGKFKDYNLIFITAEAFSPYAIDKELTPTLYQMTHNGYQFTNFYNPIWGVSTSDGEYVATTGLIPKGGVWSFYRSANNSLPFVMGNQLRKLGYKTVAYHDHTFDYYRRDVSHPNMGYTYKAVGNGLELKDTWPESDVEMMKITIPEYINEQPFHAYYMTVSGHMQYSFSGNYIAHKNKKSVENLPYSDQAKAYLATQIELDRALKFLLESLEKAGIADRTLIAISPDHYPYGLEKKAIDELAGHAVEDNFELYKSSFILYSKNMEPTTVSAPTSSLDIIPTLSNLLGLSYDSRLLMGRDVFSDAKPLVIFQNKSFITDKGKYNAVTHQFFPNKGVTVDKQYIGQMAAIVNSKFYYSAKILDLNYYAKIPLLSTKR
ncbi:LTA synthase family protein [Caldibacillus lycopersici]|uniref:LTA synthase family protein n=2 Tax=Perspicuibacillus lycopersici TaxID=1325689 RepID=A0AAE3LQE0_9BACI|nr:LTA synthase family protein [Perspicuibacillus lycopersici]